MCPHCKQNPIQTIAYVNSVLLCVACTMGALPALLARQRALPPIYSAHCNAPPDLFPRLEQRTVARPIVVPSYIVEEVVSCQM